MLGNPIMMGASAGGVAAVSRTANAVNASNLTTYTFTSQSLGAAAGNRKIVVCVNCTHGSSGISVSSLTVGGVSASLVKAQPANTETSYRTEIWQADVAAGTTGNVAVTFSSAPNQCGIGVYRVTGAKSAAHATAGDNTSPGSETINVPANGILIGSAGNNGGVVAWSGITENYDEVTEGTARQTGASGGFDTEQTALAITATYSGGPSRRSMALASWGPA
jgi:hypothetical protein